MNINESDRNLSQSEGFFSNGQLRWLTLSSFVSITVFAMATGLAVYGYLWYIGKRLEIAGKGVADDLFELPSL